MKYVVNRVNILFLVSLAVVIFLPSENEINSVWAYVAVLFFIEIAALVSYIRKNKKSTLDVASLAYLLLIFWDVMSRLGLTHAVLVPSPENVFNVFVVDWQDMITGVGSSLWLLLFGVGSALILGVFLGLAVGWIPWLKGAVMPIANVISPIPPLVYTPYVVAVMPTFRISAIFVIFCAVFWPTFQLMVNRVSSVDKKVIQSAQVMNVSTPKMLFKVILPYCMPGLIGSLNMSIKSALLCLVGAELLGSSSGLGYYVKKYSDFANYTKVLAGIILMGVVVTVLISLVNLLQRKAVKWDYT